MDKKADQESRKGNKMIIEARAPTFKNKTTPVANSGQFAES